MSERETRSIIRLAKLILFGVLGALAVTLLQATEGGTLDLDPKVLSAVLIAAVAGSLEKWVRWETVDDPDFS